MPFMQCRSRIVHNSAPSMQLGILEEAVEMEEYLHGEQISGASGITNYRILMESGKRAEKKEVATADSLGHVDSIDE
ncbi:hypothetical protein PFISCL1PPCAC_28496 [Pristionchus fissidentatus]|uniref:Uncharacterized protein n=1 Tax=Pristionchus fissidentatus TaxID=1538716 RepID=A0AAV5WP38_9BILA|nr:hypothetical protein PFISCL1PPCAC_25201 [Pristionchus fissidentatus]GMT37199.1 hypothetical protein PFISCL1PPCAC_28496 [Pristionchus fissidentatus]